MGTTNLTCIATSTSGLKDTCFVEVSVKDTTRPACEPKAIELALSPQGTATISTNAIIPFFTDNCSDFNVSLSKSSFNCQDLGRTGIIATARDAAGNVTTCPIEITVVDKIAPSCIAQNISLKAEDGKGALVSYDYTASDNCGVPTVSFSITDKQYLECGEYNVVMTVRDGSGNTSQCEFTVTVDGCEGCCKSREDFMALTDQGFGIQSNFDREGNCVAQIFPPALTACQFVSKLEWGDGTVTNGVFPASLEFTHEYIDIGIYEVCVTMQESDNASCFQNKVCQWYQVKNDCSIITKSFDETLQQFDLYPNPTSGLLAMRNNSVIALTLIYDINGQLLKTINDSKVIDVSDLPAGLYLVRYGNTTSMRVQRIIKMDGL